MFELSEEANSLAIVDGISLATLSVARTWRKRELISTVRRSVKEGWITRIGNQIKLTKKGKIEAARLTRQHRLWELFLIHHADVAPSRVDREADHIEHVLEPETVAELETILSEDRQRIPQSPHELPHQQHDSSAARNVANDLEKKRVNIRNQENC